MSALPPDAAARIDRVCDGFEAAWNVGRHPVAEQYLGETQGAERIELLRQLLLLELDYRQRSGEQLTAAEYHARLPQYVEVVNGVFQQQGLPASQDPAGSPDRADSGSFGTTSAGLINGIRAADTSAWQRMVSLYGPLIYDWCRDAGVASQDSPDVMQDVLGSVAQSIGSFRGDGPRGTFRAWLRSITRRRIADHFRSRGNEPRAVGGTGAQQHLLDLAEPADLSETDDANDQRMVWRRAIDAARAEFEERTWQAFYKVAVDGESPADVARSLGLTVPAVYQAKSRVLRRVRQVVAELA